jgi:hypothetical protein
MWGCRWWPAGPKPWACVLIVNTAAAVISVSPTRSGPRQGRCRFARWGQCRSDADHLRQQQSRSADIHPSSMHPSPNGGCTQGAHNLRVRLVTGRSGAPKVGDVRHRKSVDPGILSRPFSPRSLPPGNSLPLPRRATMRPRLSTTQCASLCALARTSLRSSAEYDALFGSFCSDKERNLRRIWQDGTAHVAR